MYWFLWIVIIGIVLLAVFNVIPSRPTADAGEDAIDILKKRFARGEIEREEFEERKKILKLNK
jgi:putative membrane protein